MTGIIYDLCDIPPNKRFKYCTKILKLKGLSDYYFIFEVAKPANFVRTQDNEYLGYLDYNREEGLLFYKEGFGKKYKIIRCSLSPKLTKEEMKKQFYDDTRCK